MWVLFPTLGRRPTGFQRDKCLKAWVRILALTNFLPGYLSVHQRCVCTHVCIFLFLHLCVFIVLLISFQNTVCFNISLTIPHVCVPLSFNICVFLFLWKLCVSIIPWQSHHVCSFSFTSCVCSFLFTRCVYVFFFCSSCVCFNISLTIPARVFLFLYKLCVFKYLLDNPHVCIPFSFQDACVPFFTFFLQAVRISIFPWQFPHVCSFFFTSHHGVNFAADNICCSS